MAPGPRFGAGALTRYEEVRDRVRPLRIIWLMLLVSVAVFAGVVWLLLRRDVVPTLPIGFLIYAGVVVALGLPVAPFVRRRVEASPPGADRGEVARRWQTGWLVGQVMKEGVGIVGLVLALLAGSELWALAFAVASVVSMLLTPPWERDLLARLRRAPPEPQQDPTRR